MAPEQALGVDVDGRADQYALGVVAYQMLTGQCPFTGGSAPTLLYRHIHETPRPIAELRPDVPTHLADVVAIALAKDPDHRFATMEELARALGGDRTMRSAWPSEGTVVVAAAAKRPVAPTATRGRKVAAMAAVATLVGAVVWLTPLGPRESQRRTSSTSSPTLPVQTSAPPAAESTAVVQQAAPRAPDTTPSATTPEVASPVTRRRAAASRSTRAEPTPPRQMAALTVASEPYGVLFIDDVEIGDTPVANRALEVGRSYRIRVEREGYRTRRETITVTGPNPIRRSYVLEPGGAP
jgi:serine/threonine protein kinase